MQMGVVFPQTEFESDPLAVREYAQTVEGLGFSHIDVYDHVLGANPNRPDRLRGPYTHESSFLEPFVLYGYLAAVTQKIGLATNIIILPQRQTALVAKQAATLDILSNGRLRLGVGLGWNHVEYTALNENFRNRARRIEEQVEVLRKLWTEPLVNFSGKWHAIEDAGLKPLPIQRPIPIWFGGSADEAIRRMARIADGWMSNFRDPAQAHHAVDLLKRALDEAGRDRSQFGIEARISYGEGDPRVWAEQIKHWQELGATIFSANTMGVGFDSPSAHLDALKNFAKTVGVGL